MRIIVSSVFLATIAMSGTAFGAEPLSPAKLALAKVSACARDWVQRRWVDRSTLDQAGAFLERAEDLQLHGDDAHTLARLAADCRAEARRSHRGHATAAEISAVTAEFNEAEHAAYESHDEAYLNGFPRVVRSFLVTRALAPALDSCRSGGFGISAALLLGVRVSAGIAVCRTSDYRIVAGPEVGGGRLIGFIGATDFYVNEGSDAAAYLQIAVVGGTETELSSSERQRFHGGVLGVGVALGVQHQPRRALIRFGNMNRELAELFVLAPALR